MSNSAQKPTDPCRSMGYANATPTQIKNFLDQMASSGCALTKVDENAKMLHFTSTTVEVEHALISKFMHAGVSNNKIRDEVTSEAIALITGGFYAVGSDGFHAPVGGQPHFLMFLRKPERL